MKTTLKNKFINPKLFVQGLLQLKVAGIATIVCSTIYTILLPIIAFIESRDNIEKFSLNYRLLDVAEMFLPLMIVLYIVTPIMSILLFRFMHKRSSSDFYHSIPVKRSCIFFSYMASIVTWVTIIILVFSTTLCLMTTIFLPEYILDIPVIIMYNINAIIACILMAAVFGIGLSITGTVFSGYVTSMIILIAPRLLITFICNMIAGLNKQIIAEGMALFTRNDCNMALSPILYLFNDGYYEYAVSNIPFMGFGFGTIYSILLAILYLFIGLFAFTKRPSEAAGKAYSHKIFNFITKLSIGYVITLFIVYIMVETEEYFSTTYLIIFAFALISMFVYEVILSKSIKRGLKSFLSTPILIALDVVTILCIFAISHFIKNEQFDVNDIDYIKLDYRYTDYVFSLAPDGNLSELHTSGIDFINSSTSGYIDYDYFDNKIDDYKIYDREIIEYVISAYNSWCSKNAESDYYEYEYYYYFDYYSDIKLTIGDAFGDTERILFLDTEQYNHLKSLVSQNVDTNSYVQNSIPDSASDVVLDCDGLTYEQIEELYEVLIAEYKALSPEVFKNFIRYNIAYTDYVGTIKAYQYVDDEIEYFILPITSLTPKAFNMYISYYNENHKEDVLNLMAELKKDLDTDYDASLYVGALNARWDNDTIYEVEYPFYRNVHYATLNLLHATPSLVDGAINYLSGTDYTDFSQYGKEGYYLAYIRFEVYKDSTLYSDDYDEYVGQTGFYMMLDKKADAILIEELQRLESAYAQ
ncbi:MAG: ABC transporter permease [Lachnospiraceae bacterium]|nr:ABC transporter permease [Lachnospiraceae bacterium]